MQSQVLWGWVNQEREGGYEQGRTMAILPGAFAACGPGIKAPYLAFGALQSGSGWASPLISVFLSVRPLWWPGWLVSISVFILLFLYLLFLRERESEQVH